MTDRLRVADASVASRGRVAGAAAFFAQGFVFAVVLTHLGDFKDRWGVDDLAITVIIFVVAILAAVGSGGAAWLAARWGSAAALRIGLVTAAVAVVGVGLAGQFVVFCAALGVYGLALGCVDAASNMQAVACEDLQGRSILTSFHAAWSAGGIAGALLTAGTSQWSLAAALVPVAVVPVLAAVTPLLPVSAGSSADGSSSPTAGAVLAIPWRTMAVLGLGIVLFYVADSATQSWSTIYLQDVLLASGGIAPLGYAAYQATSLVSRISGDHVVRRMGAGRVVRMAAVVGAVGLAMVVAAQVAWMAIAGFAILGLGIAVIAPLSFAAAGRLAALDTPPTAGAMPRRAVADAIIARVNLANYVGFVLGGVLTGLVASASSMREGFVVPLVGIVLVLPFARAFSAGRGGGRGGGGGGGRVTGGGSRGDRGHRSDPPERRPGQVSSP